VVGTSTGERLAAVQLVGTEDDVRLELTSSAGAVLWATVVPAHVKDFSIPLPGPALAAADRLNLVVDGARVRSVSP
jgi:hypothetical protein